MSFLQSHGLWGFIWSVAAGVLVTYLINRLLELIQATREVGYQIEGLRDDIKAMREEATEDIGGRIARALSSYDCREEIAPLLVPLVLTVADGLKETQRERETARIVAESRWNAENERVRTMWDEKRAAQSD